MSFLKVFEEQRFHLDRGYVLVHALDCDFEHVALLDAEGHQRHEVPRVGPALSVNDGDGGLVELCLLHNEPRMPGVQADRGLYRIHE